MSAARTAALAAAFVTSALVVSANCAQASLPDLRAPETVPRRVRVLDFRGRTPPFSVVFRYTALVPGAAGQADILQGEGHLNLHAFFTNLPPASRLGGDYLTYVLWSVTPEGRTSNLGEIELTGTDGEIKTKISSLRFGLIVTAEPYLSVSYPNKAVVFEADVPPRTTPAVPVSQALCELLSAPISADLVSAVATPLEDAAEPLEIREGRRAVTAARAAGAEHYAPDTFHTAQQLLQIAEDLHTRGAPDKDVNDAGSEAAFVAEDARVLAVTRQQRAPQGRASSAKDP